jgi:hypothetical protein
VPVRKIVGPLALVVAAVLGALAWLLPDKPPSGSHDAAAAPSTSGPARENTPAQGEATSPKRAPIEPGRAGSTKVAIDCSVVVLDRDESEHAEEDGTLTPGLLTKRTDPDAARNLLDAWVWTPLPKTTVRAGSFQVEVPDGSSVGILEADLGGRPAHYVDAAAIRLEAGKENEFRLRWIEGLQLHVVDQTTHAELDDVTVAARSRSGFIMAVPRDALVTKVVEHGASPVTIPRYSAVDPRLEMKGQYCVRARGHAWVSTEIWNFDRGEQTVELPAGAALDIDVTGELPTRPVRAEPRSEENPDDEVAELRLSRSTEEGAADGDAFEKTVARAVALFPTMDPGSFPGGRKPTLEEFRKGLEALRFEPSGRQEIDRHMVYEQPAALGRMHLEGLLPGKFDVAVELGLADHRPLVSGSTSVELVAGETAHVEVVSKSAPFPTLVHVAGTLHVPSAWPTQGATLEIVARDLEGVSFRDRARLPLKEMAAEPGDPETLRFDAGELPSATYRFSIDAIPFLRELRIAAPDSEGVKLELPEAGTLYLTVVDAASGEPVKLRDVSWRPDTGAWSLRSPTYRFSAREGDARLVATIPLGAGDFDVGLRGEWKVEPPASAVIHAGDQEFVLRVRHVNGVRLKLRCGGAAVPWTPEMPLAVRIEPVDGDGVRTDATGFEAAATFTVSRPGRYRITLPALDGYADVEPFEVEVPQGGFVEKLVELRRR